MVKLSRKTIECRLIVLWPLGPRDPLRKTRVFFVPSMIDSSEVKVLYPV